MAHRFLTAEDVRRSSGGEILVEPDTVVTPQAAEAARAAGILIRTASGEWTEPPPDRGPDAREGLADLPHLPEPAAGEATGVVVTVVGRDRAGVLAEVTAAVAGQGANVLDVSQKTVEGYFHLILTVELPAGAPFDSFRAALAGLGGEDDYVVRVMHERVFRFMHRI